MSSIIEKILFLIKWPKIIKEAYVLLSETEVEDQDTDSEFMVVQEKEAIFIITPKPDGRDSLDYFMVMNDFHFFLF
jgi:hypothetical protein